ncbi:uncharacterized protein LOC106519475 isoform X2 [Austrofundulus limnaeus]|uniref:Uncharacterized protein LOC106519475 isoform X2 n=1 Tax=Austrofundulus limnaeus TaxID=52670 RepID=A0A2I4BFW5_AUSLI|nr:PREDICTED: uncharacterized protein LOC106519475 isoform X2 [Austrofundulus limnaeus]
MDNSASNKGHISFSTWVTPTSWPTTSAQGVVVNPRTNSQHLGLNLSDQQPLYNHPQGSNQSCTTNLSTMSSDTNRQNTAPHTLSNLILHNTSIPAASQLMSFSQQTPHTSSMRGSTSRGKTVSPEPLPQPNQGPQPCSSQHFPPLPANVPYKTFPAQLLGQAVPDQDQSVNFPSCGLNMSEDAFGGSSGESTGVDGSSQSYNSSTSQEHPQWPSSSGASSESTSTIEVNKQPSVEVNILPLLRFLPSNTTLAVFPSKFLVFVFVFFSKKS